MEDLLIPYEYVDAIFRFRISVKGVVGFSIPYEDKWMFSLFNIFVRGVADVDIL